VESAGEVKTDAKDPVIILDSSRSQLHFGFSDPQFLAKGHRAGKSAKSQSPSSIVRGRGSKGNDFLVVAPVTQTTMLDALQQRQVAIWFKEATEPGWPTWILDLAPWIFLVAL
jgi:hypothetical protein